MNAAADTFVRSHVTDANTIRWPAAEPEKADVGQTLLGMQFVRSCDYWFEHARDLVVNPQPDEPYVRPSSALAKRDRSYREALATLDERQRAAVLRLLREVAEGATFASLVILDQFPHAEVTVRLANRGDEPQDAVQVVPGPGGFAIHERWHEWLERFSTHPADAGSP